MIETIYALATPLGRSGVAVIRVSGPEAFSGLIRLMNEKSGGLPPPRRAALRSLCHPISRETIDQSLILTFPAPTSYTGEDVVEYHVHGGRAVISSLFEVFSGFPSYRMAAPGEFTRRAFENGRMDLTKAEAVADLIDAETQAQRIQALAQMEGALAGIYEGWRARLMAALAHLEADLDFPDDDLPGGILATTRPVLEKIGKEIEAHLKDSRRGERLREGIRVVILGAPNAGKSTLLNALARRDVAIVSGLPGTTRDILDVSLDIGGYPVLLSDTAGLRPNMAHKEETSHEAIESEGIRRAQARAKSADIRIFLFDASLLPFLDPQTLSLLKEEETHGFGDFLVFNKGDSFSGALPEMKGRTPILLSAKTGQGLDTLLEALLEKIRNVYAPRETPSLTRTRHRDFLEQARESLFRSLDAPLPELIAEDVRLAVRSIGQITGRVDVEDLLDVIFRDFCIGK